MKSKFAAIALLALAFTNNVFAAGEYGVEMALLNGTPNPATGDPLAFQETGGQQCQFFGIVKSPAVGLISRKVCPDGLTTSITMIVPLEKGPVSASGQKLYKAFEQGPAPLAVSFMAQFYDVPADAVEVKVVQQSQFEATVAAKAAGHTCMFSASKLPENYDSKHGWAASSMSCGK